MLESKHVNEEFQKQLRRAVRRFRDAKQPLWSHHHEQIAAMEAVVNNSHQTNRELRDNARKVCNEINGNWRNWLTRSLLTTYIEDVLNDPRFNVEKMYEVTIDQLGEAHQTDLNQIEVLVKDNKQLKEEFPKCYHDLEEKLVATESALSQATEQLKLSTEQLNQSQQLLTALNTKLENREQNYQSLLGQYMQTFENKTTFPSPRNTFSLPPPQAPWPVNALPPVKAPGSQNCNVNSAYQEQFSFRPPYSTLVGVK